MKNRLAMAGVLALCACPVASFARVWVGGDVGLTGGALAGTSPVGIYGGLSTRSFPVGLEVGYQFLSANPSNIGLFTASALYRTPIPRVRGLHVLARLGVANIQSDNNAFIRNSTRPILGVGVSYRVMQQLDLRAEYDVIIDPRVAGGPSQNGDELLAGVTYQFAMS
ncbi:outer membrane beta-barrel protein [Acidiferrobacter sp.]|uniref:outer membrane beta-barrel protein n=1 Tax=Acidiferrobacter sp. TaxID=1872107 RepID=UPI002618506A|nr:outer membrane beta-barrel protein [Acidiferrobacter sp.]